MTTLISAAKETTLNRVTRKQSKHWPPIHGPPLPTGSVDYLRTGPRTTPTDPSTDLQPNKIKKNKKTKIKISLTACPIDWQTWVQFWAQVMSFKIITFLLFSLLWPCMKERSLLRSRSGRSHVTLPVPTRLLQTDIHSFLGNKPINVWLSISCECSRLWLVQRIQWQLTERLIGPSKKKRTTLRGVHVRVGGMAVRL